MINPPWMANQAPMAATAIPSGSEAKFILDFTCDVGCCWCYQDAPSGLKLLFVAEHSPVRPRPARLFFGSGALRVCPIAQMNAGHRGMLSMSPGTV